jgi:hypothetical protein
MCSLQRDGKYGLGQPLPKQFLLDKHALASAGSNMKYDETEDNCRCYVSAFGTNPLLVGIGWNFVCVEEIRTLLRLFVLLLW